MTYESQSFRSREDRSAVVQGHELQAMNDALVEHDAWGGAWTAVTPTLGNVTLGNGTVAGRWLRRGQTVDYAGSLTFGSTTSVTGTIGVSLPVTPVAGWRQRGVATYFDNSGGQTFPGVMAVSNLGTVTFVTASGTSAAATVPFTWATDDRLNWQITFEVA